MLRVSSAHVDSAGSYWCEMLETTIRTMSTTTCVLQGDAVEDATTDPEHIYTGSHTRSGIAEVSSKPCSQLGRLAVPLGQPELQIAAFEGS
eukprot:1040335-Amphidinium_carterae.1